MPGTCTGNSASRSKPTVNWLSRGGDARLVLVAQPEVQRQRRRDAPVVLDERRVVVGVVERRASSTLTSPVAGIAEQEAGERVAGGGAGGVRVRPLRDTPG